MARSGIQFRFLTLGGSVVLLLGIGLSAVLITMTGNALSDVSDSVHLGVNGLVSEQQGYLKSVRKNLDSGLTQGINSTVETLDHSSDHLATSLHNLGEKLTASLESVVDAQNQRSRSSLDNRMARLISLYTDLAREPIENFDK